MNSGLAELGAGVGLAEGPAGGSGVVGDDAAAVAGDHPEWEALAVEVGVALPVLAPVSGHHLPPGSWSFDVHGVYVAGASHVGY